jgi:hypothetical protein
MKTFIKYIAQWYKQQLTYWNNAKQVIEEIKQGKWIPNTVISEIKNQFSCYYIRHTDHENKLLWLGNGPDSLKLYRKEIISVDDFPDIFGMFKIYVWHSGIGKIYKTEMKRAKKAEKAYKIKKKKQQLKVANNYL